MEDVITIPNKIARQGDLVLLPRIVYEKLLNAFKKRTVDSGLEEALSEVNAGKIVGPFLDSKELFHSLNSSLKK
ncbi:hypothetical protein COX24_02135 [bacterium (Candidatus Gribaldobacteria) CG23_combo_of_CG06-09_8_20_14_all_37_87_8]|uniref:Uncharacterized protein n=2 Tax=Candidatus Gribaldobacteria TaxID=2798536 RepID=A0A2G9ZEV7_9BACT|nr:MAG: hypothetical protein AUJ25_02630 [Parcubacteria group bacterium CG1_02_37_13]PIP31705.1 MAG: hypothetical protein COX24_02135 [bacterium (Candidatus Gribaldobacteria) CG23_combo_of_CG06-09_8_20_14_all_37_87_8]PIR90006.1 MAG: hypothetical protein COU05_03465 [bacterium (Candidatus Gribaldobacteria) CG10_big_fil_rev_8_21_14_0_10_37_21]